MSEATVRIYLLTTPDAVHGGGRKSFGNNKGARLPSSFRECVSRLCC